jgi:hypothetical protein
LLYPVGSIAKAATRHPIRSAPEGRILNLLHAVDEFTREALAIERRRRIDAEHTVAVLDAQRA